jgi:hypothetical protein
VINDFNLFDFNIDLKINVNDLVVKYDSFFIYDINKYFPNFVYVKSAPQSSLNDMLKNFYQIFYSIMIKNTPFVKKTSLKHPPWFNKDLINILKDKDKWRKKYQKSRLESHYEKFSYFRSEFKKINKLLYDMYVIDLCEKIKSDPKSFFDFVDYTVQQPKNRIGLTMWV